MSDVLLLDIFLLALVTVVAVFVIRMRSLFAATMLAGLYSLLMAIVWSNMHALDVGFTEAAVGAGASTVLLLGCIAATGRISKDEQRVNLPALAIVLVTGGLLIYGTLDMPSFGDPNAPIHQLRVPKLLGQDVGKHPDREAYLAAKGLRDGDPAESHPAGHGEPDAAHDEHDARADEHADEQQAHSAEPHAATDDQGDHGGGHHPHDDFNGHVPNTVTSLLAAYRGFDTMFETAVIFTAGISLVLLLRRREDDVAEEWERRAAQAHTQGPQPAHTHRNGDADPASDVPNGAVASEGDDAEGPTSTSSAAKEVET